MAWLRIAVATVGALGVAASAHGTVDSVSATDVYAPGRVIVKLRSPTASQAVSESTPSGAMRPPGAGMSAAQAREHLRARARVERARPIAPHGRALRARGRGPATSDLSRLFVVELEEGEDVVRAVRAFQADPEVEYAHPDYVMQALFTPNDPYFASNGSWGQSEDDLWGLKVMQLESAWDTTLGAGVVVAVVDTGVDLAHPDLAANAWVNPGEDLNGNGVVDPGEVNGIDDDGNGFIDDFHGFDFYRSVDTNLDGDYLDPEDVSEAYPLDEFGHGTHVAGTVAAVGNNALGVSGVAPQAKIMGVRGLGPSGNGSLSDLIEGIVYAADAGAQVINNSWGCYPCPIVPAVEDAVHYAHDLDVVVVFAAGNSSAPANRSSPQNMSETITVSALTPSDEETFFTNFGPLIDVGAPGGGDNDPMDPTAFRNVLSLLSSDVIVPDQALIVGGSYLRQAGTSMASPHVAGLAALVRAAQPGLSNEQVRQVLRHSVDPIVNPSHALGTGRVNGSQAVVSSLDAAVLIDTPEVRALSDVVALSGTASGSGLVDAQLSIGIGEEPASYLAIPTTWDPSNGSVTGSVDVVPYAEGPAVLRLVASDGSSSFESATYVEIDNVRFTEPENLAVVNGGITIGAAVGQASAPQRVQIDLLDQITGVSQTLLDVANPTASNFSVPLDTTQFLDSASSGAIYRGLGLTLTVTLAGGATEVETLQLLVENSTLADPRPGALFATTDPITLTGSSETPYRLQVGQGGGWSTVQDGPAGSFQVVFDPLAPAYGLDLAASNLVLFRLLNDVDGNGTFDDDEQNEWVNVQVEASMRVGWPQMLDDQVGWSPLVALGDIGGNNGSEVVALSTTFSGEVRLDAWIGNGNPVVDLAGATQGIPFVYYNEAPATLLELESPLGTYIPGAAGLEMLFPNYGQLHGFRSDGVPPSGFFPTAYTDGAYDLSRHADPAYRDLHGNESVVAFRDSTGKQRLVSGFRRFDVDTAQLGFLPNRVLDSSVALFDDTGMLLAESETGPGAARLENDPVHDPIVGDFDADGVYEIAVSRAVIDPSGTTIHLELQILNAETLVVEAVAENLSYRPGGDDGTLGRGLSNLSAGDLDGDGDQELVIAVTPTAGGVGPRALWAVHHDGSEVAGFPYLVGTTEDARLVRKIALGDLDLDGDAEIVLTEPSVLSQTEMPGRVEALDYDANTQSLATLNGWPYPVPASIAGEFLAIADIDGDPEPEVLFSGSVVDLEAGPAYADFDGIFMYFIEALDPDASPWQGGWKRYVRGKPFSAAVGNLDAAGPADLVVSYRLGFITRNAGPTDPTLVDRGEIVVYPLAGDYKDAKSPWTQYKGNAQHTGSVPDSDFDGLPDQIDNCPYFANPGQEDHDGDGIGTGCDAECSDGIDNDGDGFTDYPADNGCLTEGQDDESPDCSDGVDNDGDGTIDFAGGPGGEPADPQCQGLPWWHTEGFISCGLVGLELLPVLGWAFWRRRRCAG